METLSTDAPSYLLEGQGIDDVDAVRGYVAFIEQSGKEIDSVVMERTERGIVVHVCKQDGNRRTLDGVNWYAPGKAPRDYSDYARIWHRFVYPQGQESRAAMLAGLLGVPLVVEDHPQGLFLETWMRKRRGEAVDVLEVPSLHVISITDPV